MSGPILGLILLALLVLAIVLEGVRQRHKLKRQGEILGGRPSLLGVGMLELQGFLQPDRKVELAIAHARKQELDQTGEAEGRGGGEDLGALLIRQERSEDLEEVRRLNVAAFEGPGEADLVDLLRSRGKAVLSLVALVETRIAGHILFTRVRIDGREGIRALGLAPMAVRPDLQGRGIGSRLVREGLEGCRRRGWEVVVVLGHPSYYPRFGFRPAEELGLRCTFDAPPGAFMAMELREGILAGARLPEEGALARYEPEFEET